MEKEILEIQGILDQLLVQAALSAAKQNAIISMVFGVWGEILSEDQIKNIRENFAHILETSSNEALDGLRNILYDDALLLRQRLDLLSQCQQIKQGY